MRETEARFRVDPGWIPSHPLLNKLFISAKEYREVNVIFTSLFCPPDGKPIPLRLRKYMYDASGWCTVEFTRKGPNKGRGKIVRDREEDTVTIHPVSLHTFEVIRAFIVRLGFEENFVYEKRVREIHYYTRRKNLVKIFWTTLPCIGDRIEIEGESARIVVSVARALGIASFQAEAESYRDAYHAYCRVKECEPGNLVFGEEPYD